MLLSKASYSAFRLYMYCQYVFPGNWTHNLFALLTQWSTTEPQGHLLVWSSFNMVIKCIPDASLVTTCVRMQYFDTLHLTLMIAQNVLFLMKTRPRWLFELSVYKPWVRKVLDPLGCRTWEFLLTSIEKHISNSFAYCPKIQTFSLLKL